ncbi:SpoIIE family protein phosphatase [Vallicoccus soli]|uniref:GAF domain-containing protein n=1 Tax=Vallicoccus soli TaxID=2339232 RepID=A0A3A3Z1F0_9ACTN|nr:SpoIIE family protein phosphatase [Vallicoccus soli]RJK96412.1 GAF domain-containing protein [Vallicoccus soli]
MVERVVAGARFGDVLGPLRAAWETAPVHVMATEGPEHVVAYQNARSREAFGDHVGEPVLAAFPEGSREALDRVLATGEVVEVARRALRVRRADGGGVVMTYVLAPWGEGRPCGVVVTAVDVTAAVRAEQASARARLLGEISDAMARAADPVAALQALADALVPGTADVAAVFASRGDGSLSDHGAVPEGPVALALAADLAAAGHPPPPAARDEAPPWDAAVSAGETVVLDLDEQPLDVVAGDAATGAWLRAVDARSVVVLPLVVAGVLTGGLVLLTTRARGPLDADALAFLEDVAARAGSAVSEAGRRRRQRQVAHDLQHALLPAAPPRLPEATVAARYVAGAADVEVGGDWWDVSDLGAGRIALGVGDVSGRGVPAAVVMGHARAAMRAAGYADLPPSAVLSLLDHQLVELVDPPDGPPADGDGPRFATACYAVVEPGVDVLRVANAGHPPLLVRGPDGRVSVAPLPAGAPLGLGLGGYEDALVLAPPGSTLALFTDGLVESRRRDLDQGLALLAGELERLHGEPDLDAQADAVLAALAPGHDAPDDVALVLVRLEAVAGVLARLDERVTHPREVAAARSRAGEEVRTVAGRALGSAVEHVVSELLANALEHGAPPVDLHLRVTGARAVVEVSDRGVALPMPRRAGTADEGGRGLALTTALSTRWGTRTRIGGKTVWAELLLPRG